MHILWLPIHLVRAITRSDWAFCLGFFEALILLPKVIKFSIKTKRQFILGDAEVISHL
jgi:hypothetical protein